jgi:hypothetical protein
VGHVKVKNKGKMSRLMVNALKLIWLFMCFLKSISCGVGVGHSNNVGDDLPKEPERRREDLISYTCCT